MPVGTTHSASEQGSRLKRSCLPRCTLPARLQCECVSASKGAGSAETLSRHHSVLVHVAATRGILRSCSRGGLHSGPVQQSHKSGSGSNCLSCSRVCVSVRMRACQLSYFCLRLRCTRSAGPLLRSRVDQTHSHRTNACEATGCGMPAALGACLSAAHGAAGGFA